MVVIQEQVGEEHIIANDEAEEVGSNIFLFVIYFDALLYYYLYIISVFFDL
jgi:hypothetical protein